MNVMEQGSGQITRQRLLIADDEPDIGEVLSAVAEDFGFEVTYVQDGGQVVSQTAATQPSIIMLDLRMPGTDGVEILRELAKMSCQASIILISGMDQRTLNTVETLGRDKNLHMAGTLVKPIHPEAIESLLEPLKTQQEIPAQSDTAIHAAQVMQYGPLVLYELEEALTEVSKSRQRACIDCCWRMDAGELIIGKRLSKWSENQGVSKGMLNFYLLEAMRQWQIMKNPNGSLELVFRIDSALLEDVNVADFLAEIVEVNSVPHDVLIIETLLDDILAARESAIDVLTRLRINGFKIAAVTAADDDDLLVMIDKLPIDEIVVDMASLNAEKGFRNEIELEFQYSSLTSVAHKKGLEASAINVNTRRVHGLVEKCRFDWARGGVVSDPVTDSDLQHLLLSQ